MTSPTISALHTYPVKSCAGIPAARVHVDDRGFANDRRWMIVGALDYIFLSQRSFPRMALIRPALESDHLRLCAPEMDDLLVPRRNDNGSIHQARIWMDLCDSVDDGDAAAEWLTKFLKIKCRLVHMRDGYERKVDPKRAPQGANVGFTDGYPILLISQASLDNLNSKLATPVPMDRFRPNIVVSGCNPHAEDEWKKIKIGGIEFEIVKPCDRCMMTMVDQTTAEKRGPEPLQTLATYRKEPGGVMFGQNVVNLGIGEFGVGDAVDLMS